MSVVISMLSLAPGTMGGSETYARELVRALGTSDLDVSTLVPAAAAGFSEGVPETVLPRFRIASTPAHRALGLLAGRTLAAPRTGAGVEASVVHFPFTVPVPRPGARQRSVVSLLDVQHLDLPALFSRAERAYRAVAYDRAARRADAVVTLSAFSRAADRAPPGHRPGPGARGPPRGAARPFRALGGAPENYVVYPAKAWPHKNHATLFEAFRLLRQQDLGLRLVLTGAAADDLPPLPPGAEARGTVPAAELAGLLGRARAMVFPSRYEGFGLPVLEAMSAGCPVAAARSGAVPEVAGDAAVLFDPVDAEDMARAVREVFDTSADLRRRGLARADRFTWASCAAVHERVYRELGG